ncbi:MAG: NADH-quinone oxidoreductase subunit M, partial [Phycisphaerae bacterium]
KEYYVLMLLLHGAMLGVFCARDLLLFYVFFEFTLIPLYFIIAIWGGRERRRAANMFFIYTLAGSMFTFAGVLYLGWLSYGFGPGGHAVFSFDMDRLYQMADAGALTSNVQWWLFLALFAGFAIKAPVFPFHTWLPLAHTEAPTAGSAILAGVLLKLGTYGLLRISLPILPEGTWAWAPLLAVLAIIGILYGAVAAWVQRDVKKLVAYSSVSHLGFCVLGLLCMNMAGLSGSLLYMLNHGLSTAALFFVIGMIYERYHTRNIDQLGGLARKMPRMAFFLIVFSLSSLGLPGLNGFVSEFLVLLGTFTSGQAGAVTPPGPLGITHATFAALGIVLSAAYLLHMCRCLLFGPEKEPDHGMDRMSGLSQDLNGREVLVLTPIAVLCLLLGVAPRPVLDVIQPPLERQTLSRLAAAGFAQHERSIDIEELLAPDEDQAVAGRDPEGLASRRSGREPKREMTTPTRDIASRRHDAEPTRGLQRGAP